MNQKPAKVIIEIRAQGWNKKVLSESGAVLSDRSMMMVGYDEAKALKPGSLEDDLGHEFVDISEALSSNDPMYVAEALMELQ